MNNLNELEKQKINQFLEDEVMSNAVKKVILADIYGSGVQEAGEPDKQQNWVFGLVMDEMGRDYKQTNEELGEKLRACVEGIRTVQLAWKHLESLKPINIETKPQINEAR